VLGINTRKYHGLLVAALSPPVDRRVCLLKLDEEVNVGNSIYPLSANEFQDGVFPKGYMFLKGFSVSPFPKYIYVLDDVEVRKIIFMPYGKNAVITIYRILNKSDLNVKIRVFSLIDWRHFHSVTNRWRIPWEFVSKHESKGIDISFEDSHGTLAMRTTKGRYFPTGKWFEKVYLREEAKRGESCLNDSYQSGYFEIEVKAKENEKIAIIAVAERNETYTRRVLTELPANLYDIEALYERELRHHENLLTKFYESHRNILVNDWLNWIILATNMFIVRGLDPKQKSVIAGYYWFETWGRDTFISLPGLMLVTGRYVDAREVFLTFKERSRQGLIPNFLPDQAGQPAYNAVDATLWYVNAVLQYLKYTGDFKFVQEQLWETLITVVDKHEQGTAFNILLDGDGLLRHGSQLTWMDAAIDGQPVTPRAGKAVEVQALWYNTLKIMELLAGRFKEKDKTEKYAQMAEKAKRSFVDKFWNPKKNCLFDTITEDGADTSMRPNQIFAVALDFSMLNGTKCEKIVDVVHQELSTPYGLRTLARNDPRYVGIYAGDRRSRDKAYHNGAVWPWLLGPFITAFLKTKGHVEYRREYTLKNFLMPLFTTQIRNFGLGTLNEVFDDESPCVPRGCIAQSWSVAEPLRVYVEDVVYVRPKYENEVLQRL